MPALNETPEDGKPNGERIAKVIARSGLCSRRDAEVLIGEKRVSVNGAVIESAALDVSPSDKVLVDGKPLAAREPPRLWRYHKPKGRVTTHKDPEGRPTVFDALPENLPRLISVGRLDFNTEGLLLLTNDGDLARHLELPSTGWARRYRVRAFGQIEQSKLDELAAGLRTDGVNYGPIEATLEREKGDNVWITLSIREGKNREVRRIMEHLGLSVNRLIRVSFGPFTLGDIEPGQIEEVKTSVLKDQLGPRLARQLGVKRQPVREERRLPPARSKPTYLRRKQDAVEKPERLREERPMRRRRILAEGGEAAKVELVPDKKRRPARFDRGGEGGPEQRALRRHGEKPEGEDREHRSGRDDSKYTRGEARPGDNRAERREDRRSQSAGERPRWKSSSDRSSEDRRSEQREERPRWKTSPERGTGRARSHFRRDGDEQRPKAAPEPRGEGSQRDEPRPYRQRRAEEGRSNGDRPKPFEKRFQRREDGREENRGARHGREAETHAVKGEAESRRMQRPEGRSQRPQRRAEGASEGGKPRFFEKRGSDGSKRVARTRGEGGKPFKPRAGSAQRPRPGGPRKPRPKAGEETP
ncbi:MAG: pseudouridine synthase [Rhodomicrobium sp.]